MGVTAAGACVAWARRAAFQDGRLLLMIIVPGEREAAAATASKQTRYVKERGCLRCVRHTTTAGILFSVVIHCSL